MTQAPKGNSFDESFYGSAWGDFQQKERQVIQQDTSQGFNLNSLLEADKVVYGGRTPINTAPTTRDPTHSDMESDPVRERNRPSLIDFPQQRGASPFDKPRSFDNADMTSSDLMSRIRDMYKDSIQQQTERAKRLSRGEK